MSRISSGLMIALLLFVVFSDAAESRRNPVLPESSEDVVEGDVDSCQGPGEDECLMRRTLADRTDYIYTQNTNP